MIKNRGLIKVKIKSPWRRTGGEIATLGFSSGAPPLAAFPLTRLAFADSSAAADPSCSVLDAF